MNIQPFTIAIPQETLDYLHERLDAPGGLMRPRIPVGTMARIWAI